MKKLFLLIVAAIFLNTLVIAQISQPGSPKSFEYLKTGDELSQVKFALMPFIDIEALKAEDLEIDELKDRPWRFGQVHQVSLNPNNSGTWDILGNGTKIWRLGINCEGALSINILFDMYKLPAGAQLFVYSADRKEILGAFTNINNQEDNLFPVSFIFSDNVIVEYNEPKGVEFEGKLSISEVTHGYRTLADYVKAFGQAGSCNVNVACPQGAAWGNQINSVLMLASSNGVSNGFCSGALINNTNNDGTPYFLSANHCYSAPGSVFYIFNWQSATCSNPGSSPSFQSVAGATDRARNAASDFWLVQLNTTPPQSYNPYYSGWNRTTDATMSGTIWGIHHPRGDIKKISWATGGATTSNYLGATGSGTTHWRVGSWSDGTTTEGGSSGSPLFDPQGRIMGQLHGGYAACGNTDPDWYGKLGVSWTGGGTNATRLSNWLDPSSTGVVVIDGYDPFGITYTTDAQMQSITHPVASYNSLETITPTVVVRNNGTANITTGTVSYTLNGGTAITTSLGALASGATTNITFPAITLTAGNQVFVATVTVAGDENPGNNSLTRNFSVVDCGTPVSLPFNQGFNSGSIPSCWTQEYVSAHNHNWQFGAGNGGSNPASAFEGSGNAYFKITGTPRGRTTKLVTPKLGLADFADVVLSFRLYNQFWSPDQDVLRVYYKNSSAGSWVLLNTYNTSVTAWTPITINIPNGVLTNDFYIAFEGEANWGYGVCIDAVSITGEAASGVLNPTAFTGTGVSESQINLGWTKNASNNNVMVAVNTTNTFGTPSGAYTVGQAIAGGGTIIYRADGTSFNHTSLNPSTTYYYKAWSYNGTNQYSSGVTANATTQCGIINTFPYNQNFDGGSGLCWTVQSNSTTTWAPITTFTIGGTTIINPVSGSHFYRCNWHGTDSQNEWLLTPTFNFTGVNPQMKFWFNGSYYWSVADYDNCDLDVMVRVNGGAWTKIWGETDHPNFTSTDVNWVWLETTLSLSAYAGQSNVQFAFRYTGTDGAAFSVDNITIEHAGGILGDVNGDGFVNVGDVVWIVSHLNGSTPGGFIMANADVNGDGSVNLADLTAMINIILGLKIESSSINSLPGDIYINENGKITFKSDGSITALQFVISGDNMQDASITEIIDNFTISVINDGNSLHGIIYNMELDTFNNTEIELFSIHNVDLFNLTWEMAVAANTEHELVTVNTHDLNSPVTDGNITSDVFSAKVFPNPSTGIFNIKLNIPDQSFINIRIIDEKGRVVYSKQNIEYNQGMHIISFDQLNTKMSGVYFLQVTGFDSAKQNTIFKHEERIIIAR
ncbi:MAG: T9SS type A sorting domain-containing protein [Bacteroidetes bacterium]|nr:T9SS type A sorting domain-containing protein [Bacteroidota bacterium]